MEGGHLNYLRFGNKKGLRCGKNKKIRNFVVRTLTYRKIVDKNSNPSFLNIHPYCLKISTVQPDTITSTEHPRSRKEKGMTRQKKFCCRKEKTLSISCDVLYFLRRGPSNQPTKPTLPSHVQGEVKESVLKETPPPSSPKLST